MLLRELHGNGDPHPLQIPLRLRQLRLEAGIELAEHILPVLLPGLHIVQPPFHLGGEAGVHNIGEFVFHQGGDHLAQHRGLEAFPLLDDIVPVHNGGDGGGVGGGTPNALFLQQPDQGGLGEPGGGLGEVLGGIVFLRSNRLPLNQIGQGSELLCLVVVLPLLIHGGKAGELHGRVVGTIDMPVGHHINGHGAVYRIGHLAGQEAAPDELIELVLLRGQAFANLLGNQVHIGGADGLVGILGIALAFEAAGLRRIIRLPVSGQNQVLCRRQRLLRKAQRVRTHIGNQTHSALAGDVDALIQLLRHGHGAPGCHIQLAGGLLLQGGGDKGRGGLTLLLALLHGLHHKGAGGRFPHHLLYLLTGVELRLFVPPVVVGQEAALIGVQALKSDLQGPVFLGLEGTDFLLPLHHQAGRHRLDPSGRQTPAQLPPQQGRELIAHNPVQQPPCLLGIHQILVDGPGGGDGGLDHLFGDLVEGDTIGLVVRDVQKLLQMPGDGLALPVRVRGQIDPAAFFGGLFQVVNHVLFVLNGLIDGLQVVVEINADFAFGQIPDMTEGGLHLIVRPQVFAYGFCFCW